MTGVHGPPQRTHGDHDNNVKVYVRVKPVKQAEKTCLEVQGEKSIVIGARNQFTYDSVLDSSCTQEDMYQAVGKSMTENCLRGYNGTVFAYGQTGSGKTFTIQGPDAASAPAAVQDPQRGLAPRILQNLFALINRDVNNSGGNHVYTVKCSLFEIYNEQITDLLQPHVANLSTPSPTSQEHISCVSLFYVSTVLLCSTRESLRNAQCSMLTLRSCLRQAWPGHHHRRCKGTGGEQCRGSDQAAALGCEAPPRVLHWHERAVLSLTHDLLCVH